MRETVYSCKRKIRTIELLVANSPLFREASASALAAIPEADPPGQRFQYWNPLEREEHVFVSSLYFSDDFF
ncbi:MAG: hypothetical protein ACC651_16750 [Candidatus Scalindua sp.]